MYNGQYFKALIHVVIFAVLISISDHYGIFGIFIAAWVLYQSFEAFHTAKARRDGEPLPDPLGLNEVGNWLNLGMRPQNPVQPGAGPGPVNPGQSGQGQPMGGAQPPYAGQYQAASQQSSYQPPYQAPYQGPYVPPVPPVPLPMPPAYWRRREPIGAVILIGLGLLFLMGQLDLFSGRLFEYSWPVLLIGLGIWLMVRRLGESQGGSK